MKKGDPGRLNNIKELCEKNRLVSISDRKYVERLASQYLYKEEKRQLPKAQSSSKKSEIEFEKIEIPKKTHETQLLEKPEIVRLDTKNKNKRMEFTPRNKILLAIATIILAVIVIGAVALYGGNISFERNPVEPEPKPIGLTPPYIFLETDEQSYNLADIISISGESNPIIRGEVRISISNPSGKLIWAENVQVKNDGKFSTLVIAGGQGWENSGGYTLKAEDDSLTNQITFDFKS